MKKNIIGKIIVILLVISATVEIGITIGYYMLVNIDFNKFESNYTIEVVK